MSETLRDLVVSLSLNSDNFTRNIKSMEFARTMIDLGNSTDIVASDAASTLAKFANIMQMDQSLFQNLGSTLVDLGNNYATTESRSWKCPCALPVRAGRSAFPKRRFWASQPRFLP